MGELMVVEAAVAINSDISDCGDINISMLAI